MTFAHAALTCGGRRLCRSSCSRRRGGQEVAWRRRGSHLRSSLSARDVIPPRNGTSKTGGLVGLHLLCIVRRSTKNPSAVTPAMNIPVSIHVVVTPVMLKMRAMAARSQSDRRSKATKPSIHVLQPTDVLYALRHRLHVTSAGSCVIRVGSRVPQIAGLPK